MSTTFESHIASTPASLDDSGSPTTASPFFSSTKATARGRRATHTRRRRFPIRSVLIAALVAGGAGGQLVEAFGPGDAIVRSVHCPGAVSMTNETVNLGRRTVVVRRRTTTRMQYETTSVCTFGNGSTKTVSDLVRSITIYGATGLTGLLLALGATLGVRAFRSGSIVPSVGEEESAS